MSQDLLWIQQQRTRVFAVEHCDVIGRTAVVRHVDLDAVKA